MVPLCFVLKALLLRFERNILHIPPTVPDVPGLKELVSQQSVPEISEADILAFERDGYLIVRKLFDRRIMEVVEPHGWVHAWMNDLPTIERLSQLYTRNGAARSLMRDGPIGAVGARLMRSDTMSVTYQRFWNKGDLDYPHRDSYHGDGFEKKQLQPGMVSPMNCWVAVTDAPSAIAIRNGSHLPMSKIRKDCDYYDAIGPDDIGRIDCFDRHPLFPTIQDASTEQLLDLEAGDAIFFYQTTIHSGKKPPNGKKRLALCMGLVPAIDMGTILFRDGVKFHYELPYMMPNLPGHYTLWKFIQHLKRVHNTGPLRRSWAG